MLKTREPPSHLCLYLPCFANRRQLAKPANTTQQKWARHLPLTTAFVSPGVVWLWPSTPQTSATVFFLLLTPHYWAQLGSVDLEVVIGRMWGEWIRYEWWEAKDEQWEVRLVNTACLKHSDIIFEVLRKSCCSSRCKHMALWGYLCKEGSAIELNYLVPHF